MSKASQKVLSVIITAHNEGLMAHHTMLSVFRALEDFAMPYEIIVHIDCGDQATRDYFARYKDGRKIRIYENDFHDLGKSRNYAIKNARGTYISVMDADDLVSKNYFTEAMKTLKEAEQEIVVHPNYCLSFEDLGSTFCIQTLAESKTPEVDAALALIKHRWISAVSGKRKTFLKYPYMNTENGFGHEDYALSTELTTHGVLHKVARGTVYFYRKKKVSLLQTSNAQHVAQPYSELFDIDKWKELKLPVSEDSMPPKKDLKQRSMDMYVRLRRNRVLNKMIEPFANYARRKTGKKLIKTTYAYQEILDEWIDTSKIESQIFPTKDVLDHLITYDTEIIEPVATIYQKLCQQVKELPDYVFMVPWIMTGGADKVLLNYLEAIKELHPDWRIAVISMRNVENEWKDKLPDNAYLVDFGNITSELWLTDRNMLLTRLLIQMRCPKIHIINSIEAIDWINMHQELAKSQFEFSMSLFCYGIIPGTNGKGTWDFADPYITRIYPTIKHFYTDNTAVIRYVVKKEGYDENKFTVHYQPATGVTSLPPKQFDKQPKKLRILWAGRISVQKNPELLVRIARKLDSEKVHIDAYGRFDKLEQDGFEFPDDCATLSYKGPFRDFNDLHPEDYDLFLHTSMIDGMPNVILEAAAANLITIASNVGGIGDFVQTGKTGFLIDDANNEDAYVEVINKIQEDPSILNNLTKGAQKRLRERYSWKSFVKDIKRDFNL